MICWLLFVCCLLEVRDSVRRLRKREASLPSTVETPTFGRPEAWPGAAMWQQRDPALDRGGLDHLGQGPLVPPSAYSKFSLAMEGNRGDLAKAVPERALCHLLEYNSGSISCFD